MSTQQIKTVDIYHGLPVLPTDKKFTAIITGANGISGNHMLRVLGQSPERWAKIYCLSRRPPKIADGLPSNAEHVPVDFLAGPEDIASVLKRNNVSADYVFFYSYLQPAPKPGQPIWSNAEELVQVNTELLTNFLGGLDGAGIVPKRFLLQTGAKNYGVHLGPTKVPQEESDPRVEIGPNFYFTQEDALQEWAKKRNAGWNVTMPSHILGAVTDAAMNLAFPLAVYAAVSKKLNQPLKFTSDLAAWQTTQTLSSAMLSGYLAEWTVLTDAAKDQKINAGDNSAFTWEAFWPRLAGWYGIESAGPELQGKFEETESPETPRGYGPKTVTRKLYTTVAWAQRPEVKKAWAELAEEHGLIDKEFGEAERIFSFLDQALVRSQPMYYSYTKTRKLGWHGSVDSSESLLAVFRDLAKLKMIPPVPEVDIRPF